MLDKISCCAVSLRNVPRLKLKFPRIHNSYCSQFSVAAEHWPSHHVTGQHLHGEIVVLADSTADVSFFSSLDPEAHNYTRRVVVAPLLLNTTAEVYAVEEISVQWELLRLPAVHCSPSDGVQRIVSCAATTL